MIEPLQTAQHEQTGNKVNLQALQQPKGQKKVRLYENS